MVHDVDDSPWYGLAWPSSLGHFLQFKVRVAMRISGRESKPELAVSEPNSVVCGCGGGNGVGIWIRVSILGGSRTHANGLMGKDFR